jgi:hypothetical protein
MVKFRALPRGTQLVLVAGPLLLLSLFFTWQNAPVDYGRSGVATVPLDGWDAWGLLLALLVLTTVAIVALRHLTGVEFSPDIPWSRLTLGLGSTAFAVAVLKSLTDVGSTWESYAFVVLAGAVAVGCYLEWASSRRAESPLVARRRRGISSAA